ncbi:MAG: hypothetical protein HYV38_01760 [Candidatus Levybacteria bacterium]|nr:hypothetical protein [Candidatus Levybacteria bacterium]MBI2420788.1 hypothetical protein [Candidatus Levybacteria bacterium]
MNPNDVFGEVLEKGQQVVSDTAKAAKQGAIGFGKAAVGQVTGNDPIKAQQQEIIKQKKMSDEDAQKFLKDLYGPSNPDSANQPPIQKDANIAAQTSKDKEKLKVVDASLKQMLHNQTYFDPTFNRPKSEEERPVEKVEREEQEGKMEELQKAKEKPDPLQNVKTGTGERAVGVSG